MAIIHEFRWRKPGAWKRAKPLDVVATEEKHVMEEIDEGSRPAGRWERAKPLDGLLRDRRRRVTPGEVQRLEQRSRTRL